MPIGEHRPAAQHQRGFSYLLLLFSLVLAGVAAASTGQHWVQAGQREREAELAWRAQQISSALALYAAHTPAGQPPWPLALEALLEDRRHTPPQRWLRQLYADPFTGLPDWQLQRDADGSVRGLASRSRQRALGRLPPGAELQATAAGPVAVGDWWFHARPPAPPAPPGADGTAPAEPAPADAATPAAEPITEDPNANEPPPQHPEQRP